MIDITKYIRTYLINDIDIYNILNDNIYSVTIKQTNPELDTFDTLPQLVIERNVTSTDHKDFKKFTITLDLNILTTTYSQGIELATLIDNKIKGLEHTNDIRDVELQSISETYISNAFIQKMTYIITN